MLTSTLAGLSLLVIGESHLTLNNHLREPLQQALLAQGAAHVHTVGACGASPARWLKATPVDCGADQVDNKPVVLMGKEARTTPIAELIQKDKPDVVVVIIGDTMGSYTKPVFPKTWAWQETTGLAKAIAATKTACVWVGPAWGTDGGPYGKNAARTVELSRFLASNVAPCAYIDSLQFSKQGQWPTLDGQHFTQAGYASWAKAIADALNASPALKELKKP
ncbi:SGNH/GDSL hydrolase family protein [Bordetella genomosp. 12]|uniref:Cell division protein FtsQ n=1 Tax=Bordetella genomosp. 12 TaxID=463035 RepID=A0A261VB76_9BORD|nr:SGNH/GDSL hydrolase family protein [Bordetella genomosp. 12]OZI70840.1 cell division protein FtsQ [Bordetella genomosp. 12]